MIRYLLDTNICIYLIKKHPPEVLARFQQIQLKQLHIPTITVFELYTISQKIILSSAT
jgi:tRNA(fMet)-specific endonuclease VapC